MTIGVEPSGQVCGAQVTGVDLSRPLDPATVAEIRAAWLTHHVLAFPDQDIGDDDLERFTRCFGPFGDDPYIAPIPGREHVIAIRRRADETAPLFAENWHSDWSFQEHPPDGTCLFGISIPPHGGDTLFADQHAALDAMPADLRARLEGRLGVHSARGGYAPSGTYGSADQRTDRSMDIRPSDAAMATQLHPIIRAHPETGRLGIFSCLGYIIGIDGMGHDESLELLAELHAWQTRDEFVYRHRWQPGMLVMWDNRSLLHRATGGYEGHDRELHRTTIGHDPAFARAEPVTFDPHDPRYVTDGVPFDSIARVRRERPVCPTPIGSWYLARYDLVEEALRDVETYRSDLSVHSGLDGVEQVPRDQLFLSEIEEPRHGQIRRVFNAAFGPQRRAAFEPMVVESCTLLAEAWDDGQVVDLHGDYAARIPGMVMARTMGLPDDVVDRFDEWSRDGSIMARPCSPHVGDGNHGLQNMLAGELARRRSLPEMPDDVFRRLVEAEIDGAPLDDQEIVTQLHFMIQAGVHTTRGLLTHLVGRIVGDPSITATLRARPDLVEAFVEESLRHDSPVQRTTRRCTRDSTIGGVEVRAGDWLEMGIASANRDEQVYDDVDAFRLDRSGQARNLAFGTGPHVCPGAALARFEGATAVRVLLDRFASIDAVPGAWYPPIPGSLGHDPIPAVVRRSPS